MGPDHLPFFLFLFSLIIRSFYGYFSHYTEDEARLWQLGFFAIENKTVINHGMPVVYSFSLLPGSFQSLLASLPLFFSRSPFSLIVFIQILNGFSQLFFYKWITSLFPKFKNIFVFCFFIFSPWSILFSYAWNPSYLPIFSVLYAYGLTLLFKEKSLLIEKFDSHTAGHFFVLTPLLLTLQINLEVIPIVFFTFLLLAFKMIPRPSFLVFSASQLPSALTLMPWVLYKFGFSELDQPHWGFTQPVSHNIVFHFSNVFDGPHLILRLLSLVTGDTVNRFESGFLSQHLVLYPFVIFGESISVFFILISISFYFSKSRWKNAFEFLLLKKNFSLSPFFEKFDFVCLVLPFVLIFSTIFSITNLGVHSLVCFFFISYYVFFRQTQKFDLLFLFQKKKFILSYLSISLFYSLIAGGSFRSTFDMIDKYAPLICQGKQFAQLSGEFKDTAFLLCPYYQKN